MLITNTEQIHLILRLDATKSFQRSCVKGFIRYLKQHSKPWVVSTNLANRLWFSSIDSIIAAKPDITAGIFSEADLRRLSESSIPCLNLLTGEKLVGGVSVCSNDFSIGVMAADHLIARHIFNCFYYGRVQQQPQSYRRGKGFLDSFKRRHLSEPATFDFSTDDLDGDRETVCKHQQELTSLILKLVSNGPKPVGVFCFSDDLAVNIYHICRAHQLSIPHDVAIVGVDDDDVLCEMLNPELTSVRQNGLAIGHQAAEYIDHYLSTSTWPEASIWIEPNVLVARGSSDHLGVKDPLILKAMRAMQESIGEPLTITTLAKKLKVSRRLINKRFKQVLSSSPHEELIRIRLAEAKKLLVTTQRTNLAIALDCGFGGQQRFEANFLKYEGVSPLVYRKRHAPTGRNLFSSEGPQ